MQYATALLALGAEARETLRYLIATQKQDGSWYQNQWLDGSPYWQGLQLDEAAFPVLLAASLTERLLKREQDAPGLRYRGLRTTATTPGSRRTDGRIFRNTKSSFRKLFVAGA